MRLKKPEETQEKGVREKKAKRAEKGKLKKEKAAKKPRSQTYVMRKNTGLRILRALLWGMLIFVFCKGVLSCIQRDKEAVVDQMIRRFRADYGTFSARNEEVMAFAQNFAHEYLTYDVRGEEDYKRRLSGYVSSTFFNSGVIDAFQAKAEALYVQAYRIEDYSADQVDVYIQAEVEYTVRLADKQEESGYTEEVTRQPVTLKVPIYVKDGGYAVENVPLIVTDSMLLSCRTDDFYGTAVTELETAAIKTSVNNFLKAYCEQDASVIEYYLAASADKEDFAGLDGRYTYQGISRVNSYQGASGIICIVEYKIKDSGNGTVMVQRVNLLLAESDARYYIKEMNTRTGNLNIN